MKKKYCFGCASPLASPLQSSEAQESVQQKRTGLQMIFTYGDPELPEAEQHQLTEWFNALDIDGSGGAAAC